MLHLVEELTNGSIDAARCWSDPLKLVPVLHLDLDLIFSKLRSGLILQ